MSGWCPSSLLSINGFQAPFLVTFESGMKTTHHLRIALIVFTMLMCDLTQLPAQDYSATAVQKELSGLSKAEKITFIIKHYYQLYSADFQNAKTLLDWAANEARRLRLESDYAYALLYSGVVHYLSGDYPVVLEKYFGALKIFEKRGDKSGMAATHNEMAVFYHKQNDLDNCFKSLDTAEKLAREINDLERLGTTLGNRGAILSVRGRIKEAKPYYQEVYKIRLQQKDSIGLGYVLLDLAEVSLSEGDSKSCMAYIDQSSSIRENIGDRYGVVVNLVFRGEMKIREGKNMEAVRFLELGLQNAKAIGYPDLVRQASDLLAQTWKKLGDSDKAFTYHQQSDVLKDSLFGVEKTKIVEELQTRYETEKKEFQIREQGFVISRGKWIIGFLVVVVLLLTALFILWRQRSVAKRNQLLSEQKAKHQKELTIALIDSQEEERSRFASDLHDGMGQVMSSLRMVLQRASEHVPETALSLLDQMHTDIRGIAFDLSPNTLREDGLVEALRELAGRLNQSRVIKVSVEENGFSSRLPERMELSLYRISQEWLNNLFRHNTPATIHIQLIRHSDYISMVIEDDAPGFDIDRLTQSTGNGWRNIQSRLVPVSGSVNVDSVIGRQGTVFAVEIPFVS